MDYKVNTPYIEVRGQKHDTKDLKMKLFEIGKIFILKLQEGNNVKYFGTRDLKKLIKQKPIIESDFVEKKGEFELISKIIGYEKEISYIDFEDKDYCFEILTVKSGVKINFITTNPQKGCTIIEDGDCKSLNYLFSVIYELLDKEDYKGSIYLEDDSKINDVFLIIFNLVNGKDSIYCKYGFRYDIEGLEKIEKEKDKLLSFRQYLLENNFPLRSGKADNNYKKLLDEFEKENGKINIRDIPMILTSFENYSTNYQKCKFNSRCNLEEEIESQQSIDLEEIIRFSEIDEESILISEYNEYLKNFLQSNDKIKKELFPLNLNVNKFDIEVKKNLIRLYLRMLNQYGFYLKLRPLKIIDKEQPKLWIKKNSSDYILLQRIMGFYLLVGMKKLSLLLLEILLQIHKQNKNLLTEEDFKKWNKIIASYYGSC